MPVLNFKKWIVSTEIRGVKGCLFATQYTYSVFEQIENTWHEWKFWTKLPSWHWRDTTWVFELLACPIILCDICEGTITWRVETGLTFYYHLNWVFHKDTVQCPGHHPHVIITVTIINIITINSIITITSITTIITCSLPSVQVSTGATGSKLAPPHCHITNTLLSRFFCRSDFLFITSILSI